MVVWKTGIPLRSDVPNVYAQVMSMTKQKAINLLALAILMTLSAITSGFMGYLLCQLLYVAPYNLYTFAIPKWLYWATGVILPIFSLVQTLVLFKVCLYVQELKAKHIKDKLLPFAITFVPSWLLMSPWAMMWALLCKWHRLPPNTAEATYLNVLKASFEGLTLLSPMLIIAACFALYSTCIWLAFKNVFAGYLPGTACPDSPSNGT